MAGRGDATGCWAEVMRGAARFWILTFTDEVNSQALHIQEFYNKMLSNSN